MRCSTDRESVITCGAMMPTELVGKAKKWLSERSPSVYRQASVAYRSLRVAEGLAYVIENRSRIMMGQRPILISYPGEVAPRWIGGGHAALARVIGARHEAFRALIGELAEYRPWIEAIPGTAQIDSEPSWNNSFFSGIDAFAMYGLLARKRPALYLEIGSGNSTKFARRAIQDHGLTTKIVSIDPSPQAQIDSLCDTVIRNRLEETDLAHFDRLEPGDVLFFDGSHQAFMGSDVVVFFLEILPRLKPGILVHIHDIFLPYDYPEQWAERYYTEQYVLAAALMSPTPVLEVLFPAAFVDRDPDLGPMLREAWGPRSAGGAASFWARTCLPQRAARIQADSP